MSVFDFFKNAKDKEVTSYPSGIKARRCEENNEMQQLDGSIKAIYAAMIGVAMLAGVAVSVKHHNAEEKEPVKTEQTISKGTHANDSKETRIKDLTLAYDSTLLSKVTLMAEAGYPAAKGTFTALRMTNNEINASYPMSYDEKCYLTEHAKLRRDQAFPGLTANKGVDQCYHSSFKTLLEKEVEAQKKERDARNGTTHVTVSPQLLKNIQNGGR